jgi:hypothetical protein
MEYAAMSTLLPTTPTAPPPPRQALGLAAGSVRAILALGILGLCWVLAGRGALQHGADGKLLPIPETLVYLQYVMVLILAHYFAAHGKTIGRAATGASALGLPAGTIRLLLVVGYGGLAAFMFLHQDLNYEGAGKGPPMLLLSLLIGGFILGLFLQPIMTWLGGGVTPFWYQDVQAWLALLAMAGLVIMALVQIINGKLADPSLSIRTSHLEIFLAAVIGFYFGARS